jgi:tyrosine-protein phosphatase YwqE
MKIDCHSHILPGLDDGAQTLEESVFLAGKLADWGYRRVICTSHSTFKYRNTPAMVMAACDRLRAELERQGIDLELVPSMEYRLIPETWPVIRGNGWLLPWEGNHILVELPIHDPAKIGDIIPLAEIRKLLDEGYQPVLAHPERYLYLQMEDYRAFKKEGCQLQRNLGTLEGMYGEAVKRRAESLEAESLYDWIGSDLHSRKYADFFDKYVFSVQ